MLNKNLLLLLAAYGLTASSAVFAIQEITTLDEYREVCKRPGKRVIAYNSATCGACKPNEKALEEASATAPNVKIYKMDITKTDAKGKKVFDGVAKEIKLESYPTTHFIDDSGKPRVERGCMSAREMDDALYELENGKKRPAATKPAAKK